MGATDKRHGFGRASGVDIGGAKSDGMAVFSQIRLCSDIRSLKSLICKPIFDVVLHRQVAHTDIVWYVNGLYCSTLVDRMATYENI